MRIRPIRLDTEGRSASRNAFEEGGRYRSIPGNVAFSSLTTVQETGCGTRRPKTAQATALRARLILGCAAGKTNTAVARELRVTKQTVEAAIDRYLTIYNEAPKPFVWTKTADEILASVARFCHRISDSGH